MHKYDIRHPEGNDENKSKEVNVKDTINENEKQKYREKVQSYTSYQIGQKLSDNRIYNQQDI